MSNNKSNFSIRIDVKIVSVEMMKYKIIIDCINNLNFAEEKKPVSEDKPSKKIRINIIDKIIEWSNVNKKNIGINKIPPVSWILFFLKNFWWLSPEKFGIKFFL